MMLSQMMSEAVGAVVGAVDGAVVGAVVGEVDGAVVVAVVGEVDGAAVGAVERTIVGTLEAAVAREAEGIWFTSRTDVPWPLACQETVFSFDPSTAVTTPAAPLGDISLFTDRVKVRVDGKLLLRALNCSAVRENLACTVFKTP